MRKTILFIAQSADGYIDGPHGDMEWLEQFPNPDQLDYGYFDLLKRIDTLVMGRKTYDFVMQSGVDWPYADLTSYVVTRNAAFTPGTPKTFVLLPPLEEAIRALRDQPGKDIWIVGGTAVNRSLFEADLFDELMIHTIPVETGGGTPLLDDPATLDRYRLLSEMSYPNGTTMRTYGR